MAEYTVKLDKGIVEAAHAAIKVFDLFDLEQDTSYPFLDIHNWKAGGLFQKRYEFSFGNRRAVTPVDTFKAFMVVSDMGQIRQGKTAAEIADALKEIVPRLQQGEILAVRTNMGQSEIRISGLDEKGPFVDVRITIEVGIQTLIFLVQYKIEQVMLPVAGLNWVYLQPPKR